MANKSLSAGVKYGLIASLIYILLLFVQFNFGADNPLKFVVFKVITYLIILVVFLFAGLARRKELGGYASFKEIFQTIFITIVITEIVYALFAYIYVVYIDPQWMDKFMENTIRFMESKGVQQDEIDKQIQSMKEMGGGTTPTLGKSLLGIGIWIVVDSVFGLIFAAIIKKERPVFEQNR